MILLLFVLFIVFYSNSTAGDVCFD